MISPGSVVTIAGGVGAAKFLRGLVSTRGDAAANDAAVVNVADDFVLHGLSISPDLDTCMYTLAGEVNPQTGWGRVGETWAVMDELEALGGETWFRLGDRDLAVHLFRSQRLAAGVSLTEVTGELCAALDVAIALFPITDDPIETRIVVPDVGEIGFQDYFVRRQHAVQVDSVTFAGIADATASSVALSKIAEADIVVIAPSNPLVSIAPVLEVPGVTDALIKRRARNVAISPIVGGKALKGPAAAMMQSLGHEVSALGVAQMYKHLISAIVIDNADAHLEGAIEMLGLRCVVTDTVMASVDIAGTLASTTIRALD